MGIILVLTIGSLIFQYAWLPMRNYIYSPIDDARPRRLTLFLFTFMFMALAFFVHILSGLIFLVFLTIDFLTRRREIMLDESSARAVDSMDG
jgi:hypothetical protein